MSQGTDEQFEQIANLLKVNAQNYDAKNIKYIQYLDTIDKVFSGCYGWNKNDFYNELNKRLGIETNDSRRIEKDKRLLAKTSKPPKVKTRKSKKE